MSPFTSSTKKEEEDAEEGGKTWLDVVGVTLRITDVPTPSLFCHTSSPFQQIDLGFCVVCGFVACLLRFLYTIYMSLCRVGSTTVYLVEVYQACLDRSPTWIGRQSQLVVRYGAGYQDHVGGEDSLGSAPAS